MTFPGPALIEPALLGPTATREDAAALVDAARQAGCASVCLAPSFFPLRDLPEVPVAVTVAGYPTGKHHPLVKASEAHMAVANGALEAFVVLDAAGDANALIGEIVTLREAVPYPAVLRVGAGPDVVLDDEQARTLCRAAVTAGADAVVASTPGAVQAMAGAAAGDALRVVGEARPAATAAHVQSLLDAGAARVMVPVDGPDDLYTVLAGAGEPVA